MACFVFIVNIAGDLIIQYYDHLNNMFCLNLEIPFRCLDKKRKREVLHNI